MNSIIKYFTIKKEAEVNYLKIHQTKLPKISATFKDLQVKKKEYNYKGS